MTFFLRLLGFLGLKLLGKLGVTSVWSLIRALFVVAFKALVSKFRR